MPVGRLTKVRTDHRQSQRQLPAAVAGIISCMLLMRVDFSLCAVAIPQGYSADAKPDPAGCYLRNPRGSSQQPFSQTSALPWAVVPASDEPIALQCDEATMLSVNTGRVGPARLPVRRA